MPDRSKPRVPEWREDFGKYDAEDVKDACTDLFKESFGFLVPAYDKLSLFLMAVTLTLLYMTNIKMRNHLQAWMNEDWSQILPPTQYSGVEMIVFFLIFNFGLAISVVLFYRLFKKRNDPDFIKNVMMVFAILINAITGIIAGIYIVGTATYLNWLVIFPIWNIINCVLLLLMLFFNLIDEDCIVENKITPIRVLLSLTSIFIIFIFCNYVFKLYWAITFSICTIYATSFDKALQSVFPRLSNQGEEQPS
jgi:hypothetical protein